MQPYPRRWAPFALCLAASGCVGTSTGNPIGDSRGGEEHSGAYCEAVTTREVAEDEPTALGFTAAEVLATALGSRSETLRWRDLGATQYGPESGEQPLTLSVERGAAPPRFVDYERKQGGPEIGTSCPDALEIEVDLVLKSGQGALDERIRTTLSARSKEVSRAFHRLDPDALGGSLTFHQVAPAGYSVESLALEVQITPHGTSGTLTPSIARVTADAASQAASRPVAEWGLASCQGGGTAVPTDARVAGFSGSDVLSVLANGETASATWHDATETALSLSFEPGDAGICAVLEDDPFALESKKGTLLLRGTLVAASVDERIAARWAVLVTARPDAQGALEGLTVELDPNVNRVDASLEDFGLRGFDVSSYDHFGVRVGLQLSPEAVWSGAIELTGYVQPDCPTTPIEDGNGGVSSPGCPGSTPHEVARASLRSP